MSHSQYFSLEAELERAQRNELIQNKGRHQLHVALCMASSESGSDLECLPNEYCEATAKALDARLETLKSRSSGEQSADVYDDQSDSNKSMSNMLVKLTAALGKLPGLDECNYAAFKARAVIDEIEAISIGGRNDDARAIFDQLCFYVRDYTGSLRLSKRTMDHTEQSGVNEADEWNDGKSEERQMLLIAMSAVDPYDSRW